MKQKKLSERQKKMMQSVSLKTGSLICEGLVACHRGKHFSVYLPAQNRAINVSESRRFNPVVGDTVILQGDTYEHLHLTGIRDRHNALLRFDAYGRKPIASNIDWACVVIAVLPQAWPQLLAQYLTYLKLLKINPCFVVNKTDLGDPDPDIVARLDYLQKELSIPVFWGSSDRGDLVNQLLHFLSGKKAIFLGPSGAGKSSLTQGMLGLHSPQDLKIGELSQSHKGCHTTSVTQLYFLDSGAHLIDSPGVRQCSLGEISLQELLIGFPDFQKQGCRYANCDHIKSEGCAVITRSQEDSDFRMRYEDYLFLRQKFVTIGF